MGLVVGLIAAVIVLGAGGYFGYRMFAGERVNQKMATVEPSKTDTSSTAAGPSAEPPKDATATLPAQEASPGSAASSTSPGAAAGTEAAKTTSAASGTSSTSSAAPSATDQSAMPKEGSKEGAPPKMTTAKAPKAAAPAAGSAPGGAQPAAAPPPAPARAPTKASTTVAQAPAAVQPDRWQMFADDLQKCRKEDFLSRFVCEQRTRARYCEGYWGKVPQCPSTPPTDHGQ